MGRPPVVFGRLLAIFGGEFWAEPPGIAPSTVGRPLVEVRLASL
jgi:hypothetical protein